MSVTTPQAVSEARLNGLTAEDRLRLHVTDPDTFEFSYEDADGLVREIDALRATEGCGGQPTKRLEAGGIGSNYCSGCAAKISTLSAATPTNHADHILGSGEMVVEDQAELEVVALEKPEHPEAVSPFYVSAVAVSSQPWMVSVFTIPLVRKGQATTLLAEKDEKIRALMNERRSLIETKREQIEKLTRERDEAKGKLALIVDRIVYADSYGVPGSDFQCCHLCNGGGAPGVQFEHDEHCPVGQMEHDYQQWFDDIKATEDALRETEERAEAAEASLAKAVELIDWIANGNERSLGPIVTRCRDFIAEQKP